MTKEKEKGFDAETVEEEVEARAEDIGPAEEVAEEVAEEAVAVGEELEEEADELERLRVELDQSRAQAAEYLEGWQRAQAEFSNYKKRQQAERVQTMILANTTLLRRLLPVVDDFGRGVETLPPGLSQLTWCEGILLIKHKLDAIIESEGVKPIETDGRMFDPCYHEAVTYEEVSGYEDGQIIGEVQRGYTLGDRVLRPALVRVARAPEPRAEEGGDVSDAAECKDKE